MRRLAIAALFAAATLGACANDQVSYAPGVGADSDRDVFLGRMASSGPSCPAVDFHIRREAGNQLSGMVFDPNGPSLMSVAKGSIAADGTVTMTVTPMRPPGLSGTFTGRVVNDALIITLAGGNCPANNVRLTPGVQMAPH